MKLFDFGVFLAASPKEVFRVVADPRSKLRWVPAIRRVEMEIGEKPGLGTRYLASSGVGPLEFAFCERIVDWVENTRVAYEGHSPWGSFQTLVVLEPGEGGTHLNYQMGYLFPGGWVGRFVGRIIAYFVRYPLEVRSVARLRELVNGS